MKRALVLAGCGAIGLVAVGDTACGGGFGHSPSTEQLTISIESGNLGDPASPTTRIPLSFTVPQSYTVRITAMNEGKLDTSFNGYVRLSSNPGTVQAVSGPNTSGRNVQLINGVADNVSLQVLAAYGNTRLQVDDLGYVPVPAGRVPAPQCSDGKDNNDNNLIDYPVDPGCEFADDDTENGGTYASAVSSTIYYYVPRIADVNGGTVGEGTSGTPFPNSQVTVDTGYRGADDYAFSVIVTRVAASGFYVTDTSEDAPGGGGFGSVFAYNFSAPPNMKQCDRLRSLGGTASNFHGFTEMNYPTWELEEWDPTQRQCGIPEPHTLAQTCTGLTDCYGIAGGTGSLGPVEAALVRVATVAPVLDATTGKLVKAGAEVHIGAHFGPATPPGPDYVPTAGATNCDLNGDGKVDFTAGTNEDLCATNCTNDLECSEYTNYVSENEFSLVVSGLGATNPTNQQPTNLGSIRMQADGSSDATFNPVLLKGTSIGSFTGTLYYFSGGSQFTIQARCADDIVTDPTQKPIPSDTACVHARTILDTDTGN